MPIFPFLYTFAFFPFFAFPFWCNIRCPGQLPWLSPINPDALASAWPMNPNVPNRREKEKKRKKIYKPITESSIKNINRVQLFLLRHSHVQHFDSSAALGAERHKLVQRLVRSRFSVADHLPFVVFDFFFIDRFDVAQDLRLDRVGCFGRRRRFGRFRRIGSFCRSSGSSRRRGPSSWRAAPRSLEFVRVRIAASGWLLVVSALLVGWGFRIRAGFVCGFALLCFAAFFVVWFGGLVFWIGARIDVRFAFL